MPPNNVAAVHGFAHYINKQTEYINNFEPNMFSMHFTFDG